MCKLFNRFGMQTGWQGVSSAGAQPETRFCCLPGDALSATGPDSTPCRPASTPCAPGPDSHSWSAVNLHGNEIPKHYETQRAPPLYFFLPATVFGLPLRVRALVLVRWPRTGRPWGGERRGGGRRAVSASTTAAAVRIGWFVIQVIIQLSKQRIIQLSRHDKHDQGALTAMWRRPR